MIDTVLIKIRPVSLQKTHHSLHYVISDRHRNLERSLPVHHVYHLLIMNLPEEGVVWMHP